MLSSVPFGDPPCRGVEETSCQQVTGYESPSSRLSRPHGWASRSKLGARSFVPPSAQLRLDICGRPAGRHRREHGLRRIRSI